ncbi:hypothetical protein KKC1_16400 [Calderihabitans maritimus]|uniref:Uncharacterized protein n=1 Tax=Calderihabitans maritimus TaxID=1246530 RepID=A0A1Z5HSI2_9FIRM|nr:hypothetical protein KKC1_16400 [Calderihabitans maritimus]
MTMATKRMEAGRAIYTKPFYRERLVIAPDTKVIEVPIYPF